MAGPTAQGLVIPLPDPLPAFQAFASTSISSGAKYPPAGGHEQQISDQEPDDLRYTYRLNGVEVQAYWSLKDRGFIVPDGNRQTFEVDPHYTNLGQTGNYIPGETTSAGKDARHQRRPEEEFPIGTNGRIGGTGDIITITSAPDPHGLGLSVTLNGETAHFDSGDITDIVVNPGLGSNDIYVKNDLSGVPVTINDIGTDARSW